MIALDPLKVRRMAAERGLTLTKLGEMAHLSDKTLVRLRRGLPVSQRTIEKILTVQQNIAVRPGIEELLAS